MSTLQHYGILGMKWGVRRTPEELGHKPPSGKRKKSTGGFNPNDPSTFKYNNETVKTKVISEGGAEKQGLSEEDKKRIRNALIAVGAVAVVGAGIYAYSKYGKNLPSNILPAPSGGPIPTVKPPPVNLPTPPSPLPTPPTPPSPPLPAPVPQLIKQGQQTVQNVIQSAGDSLIEDTVVPDISATASTGMVDKILAAVTGGSLGESLTDMVPRASDTVLLKPPSVDVESGHSANDVLGRLKKLAEKNGVRHFESSEEAIRYFKEQFSDEALGKLTGDEINAVTEYTGEYYARLNSYLRNGTSSDAPGTRQMHQYYIEECTKALNKFRTQDSVILTRGIGWNAEGAAAFLGGKPEDLNDPTFISKLVGRTLKDEGFMSTGISDKFAFGGATLHIIAPKGTAGMYVDRISANPGEHEFLLQRGTVMKIVDYGLRNGNISDIVVEITEQLPDALSDLLKD